MSITRKCEVSGEPFIIRDEDLEFYKAVGPTVGGIKFEIPSPRLSPRERNRRRLAMRNERNFYRRPCAKTGKPIVSIFSPDKKLKVVPRDVWIGLDNTEFGRDFDFNRPFFDQFAELNALTWKANVAQNGEMVNSDYTTNTGWCKNCYLIFDSGQCQDCSYGIWIGYCRDCFDCYIAAESELCYDSISIFNCYKVLYSQRCEQCNFSAFLVDCIGCSHCLFSVNLRNKEYYVFNEHVGKERYEAIWASLFCGSAKAIKDGWSKFESFLRTQPRRATRLIDCNESIGDDLSKCERVYESYNVSEGRDSAYCWDCYFGIEQSYDVSSWGEGMFRCLEISCGGGLKEKVGIEGCLFDVYVYYGGFDILYSMSCFDASKNLFGCSELRKKEYCILNKQYTKEQYELLLPKIIQHMQRTGEWGQFFPLKCSLFGYNETIAQEYFPISELKAREIGANWSEYVSPSPDVSAAVRAEDLPDLVRDVDDSILEKAIVCGKSGKLFKLTKPELKFYREHGLPLPKYSFHERHQTRLSRVNPRALSRRKCAETGKEIISSFPADSTQRIVSEEAYLDLVG